MGGPLSERLERPLDWRIYRVHLFATSPRVFTITPPLEDAVYLRAETWSVSFSGRRFESW
jgi:hypothetical protein